MANWWSRNCQLSTLIATGSLRMCLKDLTVGKICHCLTLEGIDHGCNWNVGFVPYSDLENVVHCEASSAVAIYCFGPLKTEFICSLNNRTVIDITQLGCPPIADIHLSTISCTFACHKSKRVLRCEQPIH